jgi:hypothetical protein
MATVNEPRDVRSFPLKVDSIGRRKFSTRASSVAGDGDVGDFFQLAYEFEVHFGISMPADCKTEWISEKNDFSHLTCDRCCR